MEAQTQYDYNMYNWDEDKGFFVGIFENDEKFWEYYFANREAIDVKCKKMDDRPWHMYRVGPTIKSEK